MKVYSIQPKEVYDTLQTQGYFICDFSKSEYYNDKPFVNAYNWLAAKMNERIEKPSNIEYPIWAWYKIDGSNDLPYFNDPVVNYGDYKMLVLDIPSDKLVLTDYNKWHYPLNSSYANLEEDDELWEKKHDEFEALPIGEKERVLLESWETVFDVENSKYVQATFWQIDKDNLVEAFDLFETVDLDEAIESVSDEWDEEDRIKHGFTKEKLPKLLENYYINAQNWYYATKGQQINTNIDNLIENNKFELSNEEITKINKIKELYKLNDVRII